MIHVGIGYDVHQLVAGRKLVLGGVIILIVVAFPKGVVGMLEAVHNRRRRQTQKAALLTSGIEAAE